MMRISALNDSSDDEGSQSLSKSRQTTKEAQESAALALYNRALTLLRQGDEDGASDTFRQLLEAPFVRDAEPPEGKEILVEPGLVLKYSTYKNLGSMSAQREDYTTAMKYYLEAVMVDSSDVTVWYKIGSIALKLHRFPLARHAFEQGLDCQPRHWPCIDNVITVLYALNNYEACLVYIARALQRDPGYIKGICFLERIFYEQPMLRRHMISHFGNCDQSIFTVEVDQDEADEFIDEALAMRAKKAAMCRPSKVPVLEFTIPFTHLTWVNLGNCLIALYDHIKSSQPPVTYSCKVDLSEYKSREVMEERAAKHSAALQVLEKIDAANKTESAITSNTQLDATPQPPTQSAETAVGEEISTPQAQAITEPEASPLKYLDLATLSPIRHVGSSNGKTDITQPSPIEVVQSTVTEATSTEVVVTSAEPSTTQVITPEHSAVETDKTQATETVRASTKALAAQTIIVEDGCTKTETTLVDSITTQATNNTTLASSESNNIETGHNAQPSTSQISPVPEQGTAEVVSSTDDPAKMTTNIEELMDTKSAEIDTSFCSSEQGVAVTDTGNVELDKPVTAVTGPSAEKDDDQEALANAVPDIIGHDDTEKQDVNPSALDASTTREPTRKAPKRKKTFGPADFTEKRRSTRVRNTGSTSLKLVEDEVKIRDLVITILPSSLTQTRTEDMEVEVSHEIAVDVGWQEDRIVPVDAISSLYLVNTPFLSSTESDNVLDYIRTHQRNSGIIDLLNEFLIALAERALSIWPEGLALAYIGAYTRLHKHIILPGYLCKDVPDKRIQDMGKMVLVYSELKVDKWIGTRSRTAPSPRRSSTKLVGPNFADTMFYSDLAYLDGVSQCQDIFADQWAKFNIRVQWMTAKFNMLDSNLDDAIYSFGMTNNYLEYLEKEDRDKIKECNKTASNVIAKEALKEKRIEENKQQKMDVEEKTDADEKMDVAEKKDVAEKRDVAENRDVAEKTELEVKTTEVEKVNVEEKLDVDEKVYREDEIDEGKKTDASEKDATKGKDGEAITNAQEVVNKEKDLGNKMNIEKGINSEKVNDVADNAANEGTAKEQTITESKEKHTDEDTEKKDLGALIFLPHLHHDNRVTKDNVKQQLEWLQRCRSQDKMQDLHDSGEYEKVIRLLLETFTSPDGSKVLEIEHQERHAQLLLLMESLLNMKDYKRGMIWGEVSFNEALQKYFSSPTDSTRDEWATTMTQILVTIDKCLAEERTVIAQLTSKCTVRLTQNLMSIIEIAFDVPDTASDMAISTMLPWILLYKLVFNKEEHQQPVASGEDEEFFPLAHNSAMNLLELVHEQLGRRAWCCSRDGELLLFTVREVLVEMRAAEQSGLEHPQQKTLELMLEQCFYCLYGHPNRKKARHLQDHSSSQISLTWDRAVHVFEFFKPKTMPEYDSLKTSTVSAELESLLRRIYIMIPSDFRLPITMDEITAYIEGTSTVPTSVLEETELDLSVMSELYYLLADFYFKNKEGGKAIRFYMQDLCMNPTRFDSWAGMALARASRLEQKLSMSEQKASDGKNEGSIWKYAVASIRSFERALQLDSTNSKLWIEFGAQSYQLHAHASRQLKQLKGHGFVKQPIYPLNDESIKEATTNRADMLTIAGDCYTKAGECEVEENEEEWLQHYMLGKIAEKKAADPDEYLAHYKLALHHLHNDRARYPRKITYIYSPPHLAVETLEVYYRLHASIMKYLLKNPKDAPYAMFDQCMQEVADGPFANAREKAKALKEREADDCSNYNSTPLSIPVSTASVPTTAETILSKNKDLSEDHTYSRQRSIDSARSDAESSGDANRGAQKRPVATSGSNSMDSMQSPTTPVPITPSTPFTPSTPSTLVAGDSKFLSPMAASFHNQPPDSASLITPISTANSTTTADIFVTPLTTLPCNTDEPVVNLTPEKITPPSISHVNRESEEFSKGAPITNIKEEEVGFSAADKAKEAEVFSPDTTCVEEPDVVMKQENMPSTDVLNVDPEPCSSVDLFSPQTSQSMSQDSVLSKDIAPYRPEVSEISTDSSRIESAGEETPQTMKTELSEDKEQNSTEIVPKLETESEPVSSKMETADSVEIPPKISIVSERSQTDHAVMKIETVDALVTSMETEDPVLELQDLGLGLGLGLDLGTATPDSSSQDSATAAELERLKSEISFLNAGSTDMASNVFIDQFEQDSIKDDGECVPAIPTEVKAELEDENKDDEDVTSQNEALEALKSELQSLSAAAGSEINPDYDSPDVKIEPDTAGDWHQEHSVGEEGEEKGKAADVVESNDPTNSLLQSNDKQPLTEKIPTKDAEVEEGIVEKNIFTEQTKKVTQTPDAINESSKFIPIKHEQMETAIVVGTLEDLSGEKNKIDIVVSITPDPEIPKLECKAKEQSLKTEEQPTVEPETEQIKIVGDVKIVETETPQPNSTPNQVMETSLNKGIGESVNKAETGKEDKVEEPTNVKETLIMRSSSEDVVDKGLQESKPDSKESNVNDLLSKEPKSIVDVSDGIKASATDTSSSSSKNDSDSAVMFTKVMNQCIKALNLCLSRFPLHYKSLYRLAYVYYYNEEFKNLEFSRDLLLGNANWQYLDHMPSPGLFQEKKSTNFFQGLWRIPIVEIDRLGSFACHMLRSLQLLFPVLVGLNDHKTLFSIHVMLARTPDQGRKYLRDTDRLELARLALVHCIDIMDDEVKKHSKESDQETRISFLLDIYKVWNHCVLKQYQMSHSRAINKLLRKAFFTCMKDKVEEKPSVLEQAIRFCQYQQQQVVKSPTTPDPSPKSLPGTPTTKRVNPLEGLSGRTPQSESHRLSSGDTGTKAPGLKGITPLPSRSPLTASRLSLPMRAKISTAVSNMQAKVSSSGSKTHDLTKKHTVGNVPKKPTPGTSTSTASAIGSTKVTKKSSQAQPPFSIFESGGAGRAGLNIAEAAAIYAQLSQMSPEALLPQESMMQQMALASSFGIPNAAMPYMFTGPSLDPALWSSLAAAQIYQEGNTKSKTTLPPRQSSSGTLSSGLKQQRSTPVNAGCEPPKKIAKMTPVTTTITQKTPSSSTTSMTPRSDQQALSLSTKTSVSASTSGRSARRPGQNPLPAHMKVPPGQSKTSGMKLSAKTSQLYAVRMSSALAKLSQHQQPPAISSIQHLSASPPAKMAKKDESLSMGKSNLDPLNILATAAQTHKHSAPRPKPSYSQAVQRSTPVPQAPPVRSIKGPPTLKRPGYKRSKSVPRPAHSQQRSATTGCSQPMNLTTQGPKITSTQPKVLSSQRLAHAASHIPPGRQVTTSITTIPITTMPITTMPITTMTKASTTGLITEPNGAAKKHQSMVTSIPVVSKAPQQMIPSRVKSATPMLGPQLTTVPRSHTGIRSGVIPQRLPGHLAAPTPTPTPTPNLLVRNQKFALTSIRQSLTPAYGQGKPNQPPRQAQNSDSSDDCIILSSGQDSDSN